MPLTWIDHALALTLAILFPIRASTFGYRKLVYAAEEDVPRVRAWLYRQAMMIQWGLAAFALSLWIWRARPLSALGLTTGNTPVFLLTLLGTVALVAFLLWQTRAVAKSDEALSKVMVKLERMRRMLPHTRGEMKMFLFLSLTAGICEELLYRGFLIFYLRHWLDPLSSLLVSSVLFGFGHSYQGPRGVLTTGIVGLFLGGLYWMCGSVIPSMVLHAGGDMYSGSLAYAALRREWERVPPATLSASDPPATPLKEESVPSEPLSEE